MITNLRIKNDYVIKTYYIELQKEFISYYNKLKNTDVEFYYKILDALILASLYDIEQFRKLNKD